MAEWTGGVLTAAGRALQRKVEAGTKLELTKMKLGDGSESAGEIDDLTDLVHARASFGLSSVKVEDGLCKVTGIVLTTNVEEGFYAREWGLFAKDPDRGEILYMICLDAKPDYIPPNTVALKESAAYAMNVAVSNAENVNVTIDPEGLVTVEMMDAAINSYAPSKTGAGASGTWGINITGTAGGVVNTAPDGGTADLVKGTMAVNDHLRIRVGGKEAFGNTKNGDGWAEISTSDDGNEPIYARQYTGAFANVAYSMTLLDAKGNTVFNDGSFVGDGYYHGDTVGANWGPDAGAFFLRFAKNGSMVIEDDDWNRRRSVSSILCKLFQ